MNRFQHDNIDPDLTGKQREDALRPKGINTRTYMKAGNLFVGLSTGRRKAAKAKRKLAQ